MPEASTPELHFCVSLWPDSAEWTDICCSPSLSAAQTFFSSASSRSSNPPTQGKELIRNYLSSLIFQFSLPGRTPPFVCLDLTPPIPSCVPANEGGWMELPLQTPTSLNTMPNAAPAVVSSQQTPPPGLNSVVDHDRDHSADESWSAADSDTALAQNGSSRGLKRRRPLTVS